jgi:hypothetical protein
MTIDNVTNMLMISDPSVVEVTTVTTEISTTERTTERVTKRINATIPTSSNVTSNDPFKLDIQYFKNLKHEDYLQFMLDEGYDLRDVEL